MYPNPTHAIHCSTRHAGPKSHERNRVDSVLEVDEAAQMAGDIADDSGAGSDEADGNDKGRVSVAKS